VDRFKIPPERVFMMDETFVFFTPFSKCVLPLYGAVHRNLLFGTLVT
jgi:hypothetical protein